MGKTVIVGGGAAGISVLYQLVEFHLQQKSNDKQTIIVVEKSSIIGPGLAYSQGADDAYILNLPYSKMSPIPKEPDHFARWLKDNNNLAKWRSFFPKLDINKTEYPPRKLFGIYLADLAANIKEKALSNGINIEFIHGEVVNILPTNIDLTIHLKDQAQKLFADNVVLCIGHFPPSSKETEKFKSIQGYYETPWLIKQEDIAIQKDILILGTRLSAIDAILARTSYVGKQIQEGYKGPIGKMIAVSRTGLLPKVLSDISQDYVRRELTLEAIDTETAYGTKPISLKKLKKMFKSEINAAYENIENKKIQFSLKPVLNTNKNPIEWLEREIECAKKHTKRPWQTVLFSLYPIVPRLWDALDDDGKKEFLNKYYSFWMTYLAAFPIENAERIITLLKNENLKMLGGYDSVNYNETKNEFEVVLKDGTHLSSPYLINASGQGHDITKTDSVLLNNLLSSGIIMPHPLGGINVDFKSLQVRGKQHNIPIFVVGDPTWGSCLATADLSQIANNQVPRVINSIHSKTKIYYSTLIDSHGFIQSSTNANSETANTEQPLAYIPYISDPYC